MIDVGLVTSGAFGAVSGGHTCVRRGEGTGGGGPVGGVVVIHRWLMVLAAVWSLCGCELMPWRGEPVAVEPVIDSSELRLVAAAVRAEEALTVLALARAADNPLEEVAVPRIVPRSLLRKVSIDWIGPLETLARSLAEQAGYGFEMSGAPPPMPVIVEMEAESTALIVLLRDAGIKAGALGRLVVDARREVVLLDWGAGA